MSKRIAAGVMILLCVAQVHGARRKATAAPKGGQGVDVRKYAPNAFGLHDMIGNVAEWTSSDYIPESAWQPSSDGLRDLPKVTRGGGWRDIARWALVHRRVPYQPHQRVYNVGIRLVME